MNKQYWRYFINTWLEQYKKQFRKAMKEKKYDTVRILKENLYGNVNLTEKQKDNLWEIITRVKK